MVVKIIIEMVRMRLSGSSEEIGTLIEELEDPEDSIELRMNVLAEPRFAKAKAVQVIETFRTYIEVPLFFCHPTIIQLLFSYAFPSFNFLLVHNF